MTSRICNTCGKKYHNDKDYTENTSRWRMCDLGNLWFNCSCNSTLMLPPGKFPWYSPLSQLRKRSQSIFNELCKRDSIPYLKNDNMKVLELLNSENPNIEDLVSHLKTCPIMAGEILENARALARLRVENIEIHDLSHAVIYLGKNQLKNTIFLASIKEVKISCPVFDLDKYWHASFTTAIVAEVLTQKYANYHESEEMYLIGFLTNIGMFLQAYYYPKKLSKIIGRYNSPKNPYNWSELEKIHGIVSKDVLGEIACAIWGLPQPLMTTLTKENKELVTSKQYLSQEELAYFALQLSHWIEYRLLEIDHEVIKSIQNKLSLSTLELEALVDRLRARVTENVTLLKAS